jgi:hypothetical protein
MCTNDENVSPYLPRPRRSYAEVMRDAAMKTVGASPGEGSTALNRTEDGNVASSDPKDDPRREGEARRQWRTHP